MLFVSHNMPAITRLCKRAILIDDGKVVMDGPYGLVRHPMYTAALSISLGLACLIQSWAFFCVFCIYLVLIFLLIPVEEDGLREAYGEQDVAYQQKARRLTPFVC